MNPIKSRNDLKMNQQNDITAAGSRSSSGSDQFINIDSIHIPHKANVSNMTGRQRKKVASRSKGGDFINQRKKRRLYFACVSNEIDIQDLFDYLIGSGGSYQQQGWNYMIYDRVVWLYKESKKSPINSNGAGTGNEYSSIYQDKDIFSMQDIHHNQNHNYNKVDESNPVCSTFPLKDGLNSIEQIMATTDHYKIVESGSGAQEIFIFDFGAVVMWYVYIYIYIVCIVYISVSVFMTNI